jgi:hypothetical protein
MATTDISHFSGVFAGISCSHEATAGHSDVKVTHPNDFEQCTNSQRDIARAPWSTETNVGGKKHSAKASI